MYAQSILPVALLSLFLLGAHAEDKTAIAAKYIAQEKNGSIRAAAIQTIAGCSTTECERLLVDALNDPYWRVRYKAIQSVNAKADMTRLFMKALEDADDMVWLAAVNRLIGIGNAALPALRNAASDKNPFVREGAAVALGRIEIGVQYFSPAALTYVDSIGFCRDLRRLSAESEGILLKALHDEDQNVRRDVSDLFQCIDSPKAVAPLIENTRDPDAHVRAAALRALGRREDSRVGAVALRGLKDADTEVRAEAAELLDHVSGAEIASLAELLHDPEPDTRCLSFNFVKELPGNHLDARLANEIRTHTADLAHLWCRGLASGIKNDQVARILFEVAETSKDEKLVSNLASLLSPPSSPSILPVYRNALKNSRQPAIRRMAAGVLASKSESERYPEDLSEFYNDADPEVRSYAASLGAEVRDKRAIPVLQNLADDPDKSIRLDAIRNLESFMPDSFEFVSSCFSVIRPKEMRMNIEISARLWDRPGKLSKPCRCF